jgi:hypothetical protein
VSKEWEENAMREKFFTKGIYLLRLDDIRPKEAKPNKRIHLNCSMVLTEDEIEHGPTRIRRVWEIVANPQLDTFHVPISSQLKGIEIETYPTLPSPGTPLLVSIKNSILRDIRIDREKVSEKEWEVRLRFSLGISWDSAIWKWGEDYVFFDCYAKFSQSQAELFDDHEADREIEPSAEVQRLRTAEVEESAGELGTRPVKAPETPAIDPLRDDGSLDPNKPRRGRPRKMKVVGGKGNGDARPHA